MTSVELELLAALYGLERLPGEDDDALKRRVADLMVVRLDPETRDVELNLPLRGIEPGRYVLRDGGMEREG